MTLQIMDLKTCTTLKEYMSDRKVLVEEYEVFRSKVVLPTNLGWSNNQWTNRFNGRTPLSSAEIKALDAVLNEIRKPAVSSAL